MLTIWTHAQWDNLNDIGTYDRESAVRENHRQGTVLVRLLATEPEDPLFCTPAVAESEILPLIDWIVAEHTVNELRSWMTDVGDRRHLGAVITLCVVRAQSHLDGSGPEPTDRQVRFGRILHDAKQEIGSVNIRDWLTELVAAVVSPRVLAMAAARHWIDPDCRGAEHAVDYTK